VHIPHGGIFSNLRLPGVLGDNAKGAYASDIIYDDTNLEQLDSLAPTQMHRNVDLEILNADAQGTYRILQTALFLLPHLL
jgi:hypothetical protein